MLNDVEHKRLPPHVRKKMLIAQGALFRAEAFHAIDAVQASLRPEALARDAVSHLLAMGMAAFKGKATPGVPGIDLQTILPLVVSGVSAFSKKSLLKPALRTALAAGALGAVAALAMRRKKMQPGVSEPEA